MPLSALNGDNVVEESVNMPWYPGATLMKLLNTIDVVPKKMNLRHFVFKYSMLTDLT